LLRRTQVVEPDGRYLRHPEQLGGLEAAVTGDDPAVGSYQDRIDEAELPDAVGDLPQLPGRMGARVARIRFEGGDRPRLYVKDLCYHCSSPKCPRRGVLMHKKIQSGGNSAVAVSAVSTASRRSTTRYTALVIFSDFGWYQSI